ncbi:MAG TPA: fused MFS/spermidine synthase [Thermoanaerobaculia bacterium]|nr:fused MFS/spermidine synthase [Thermoanaerobaculia bacterium]
MTTTPRVAAFLFCSGMCALVYQTAWMREFRLIFGASTFATAAVLAIFMAGLGAGSALLGKRADAARQPLAFYGVLEIAIAVSAALTPLLLWLARAAYIATGGSVSLGVPFATVVRLALAAIVLGVPTVLMGGTLPAAARAVESNDDAGRRRLAILYGANTLGAVTGTLLSTFYFLETFGTRQTLWIAALINVLVGLTARAVGRAETLLPAEWGEDARRADEDDPSPGAPRHPLPARGASVLDVSPRLVLIAAAIVGFVFLLMEIVWYRMLSPLLGGTTFMFGLILAVALLGIGLGGVAYAMRDDRHPGTVAGFALTCTLEAVFVAIPFALGDRLAVLANLLRPIGNVGFGGYVLAWTLLTFIIVFPAAFISGIQFPLLVSLLGRGREAVGRHVGMAYAWNTAGAIAGSLAGGFGLLPLLTAPGCWRLVAIALALLGAGAAAVAIRSKQLAMSGVSLVFAVIAVAAVAAQGPTPAWRHSGIGVGRMPLSTSRNELHEWLSRVRRAMIFEAEGRESSIALIDDDDLGLIVNGKSDGSARNDAGTQVMSGLLGAVVHPHPRSALVIGLGTGTTAGWLAAIPTMERVDCVELEPAVLDAARYYETVNLDVLANRRVHNSIADGREFLLTTPHRYDVIFSEPSNPFRAGVASLFTREYYQSAVQRMNRGGIFVQWMQTYAVDAATLHSIYATVASVFPHAETWITSSGDLVLVASREPIVYDADRMRARLAAEPYRSGMHYAWRTESLEGLLAHFAASEKLTAAMASAAEALNTDDRPVVEFGFGRTVGGVVGFNAGDLIDLAVRGGAAQPAHVHGIVDWSDVELQRATIAGYVALSRVTTPEAQYRSGFAYRAERGDFGGAAQMFRERPWIPSNSYERAHVAMALASTGSDDALRFVDGLPQPEADAIAAHLRLMQDRGPEALALLERAFRGYRKNPWPLPAVMTRALADAEDIARRDRNAASRVYDVLGQEFAAGQMRARRRSARALAAAHAEGGCGMRTLEELRSFEPHPLWREEFLRLRVSCYAKMGLRDLAAEAADDLRQYRENEPAPLL